MARRKQKQKRVAEKQKKSAPPIIGTGAGPRGSNGARADLTLDVLGYTVTERPVFRQHLHEIDEDVLSSHTGPLGQQIDDTSVQCLLLLEPTCIADGQLNDDEIVAA